MMGRHSGVEEMRYLIMWQESIYVHQNQQFGSFLIFCFSLIYMQKPLSQDTDKWYKGVNYTSLLKNQNGKMQSLRRPILAHL